MALRIGFSTLTAFDAKIAKEKYNKTNSFEFIFVRVPFTHNPYFSAF